MRRIITRTVKTITTTTWTITWLNTRPPDNAEPSGDIHALVDPPVEAPDDAMVSTPPSTASAASASP